MLKYLQLDFLLVQVLLQEKSASQQTMQKLFLLEVLEQFYAGSKLHLKTFEV